MAELSSWIQAVCLRSLCSDLYHWVLFHQTLLAYPQVFFSLSSGSPGISSSQRLEFPVGVRKMGLSSRRSQLAASGFSLQTLGFVAFAPWSLWRVGDHCDQGKLYSDSLSPKLVNSGMYSWPPVCLGWAQAQKSAQTNRRNKRMNFLQGFRARTWIEGQGTPLALSGVEPETGK